MTFWEGRILAALAERYPASAAALGGRELRLRSDMLFSDFDAAPPDERESFLEAAEALELAGLVSLRWEGRRGEELRSLVLVDPEGLFRRLGRSSPAEEAESSRAAARRCAAEGATGPCGPFFGYLSLKLDPQDAAAGLDARAVADLAHLFSAMDSLPLAREGGGPAAGITPRALSVRLYADSKRLERLLGLFRPMLQRAAREGVMLPDLSSLERSFPETLVAGRLSFDAGSAGKIENGTGLVLGLPGRTARSLESVLPLGVGRAPRALGVENKESFYALAESRGDFDCIFYTAGHPNPAVADLAGALARSGFALFHAGDLDPDGILILQELREAAGREVLPFKMDGTTFDRYRAYGRPLDGSMMERVSRISEATMALPGLRGLVERILSTGVGVEQEIIDYGLE